MKALRILSGALLLGILLVLSLPVSGFVPMEEGKAGVSEAMQGDTARMTLVVTSLAPQSFKFNGERNATYRVDWGDGQTDTYTGKGPWSSDTISCEHKYSVAGTYTVLLYGVGTVGQ